MSYNTTAPIIDLDEWDKLMIVFGAALFLLLVLICLVCVLSPLCYLHKHCPFRYNDEEKIQLQPIYGSLSDPAMPPGKKGYNVAGQKGHSWHPMVPLRESELSDWSDISAPEVIEMKKERSYRDRKWSRTSDYSSCGSTITSACQLESMLAYGVTFDPNRGKLQIRIIQLGNFIVTEPDGAMAPYIKVRVYRTPKHFFTFKLKSKDLPRNNLESENQTKIQRRSDNPVFNEIFNVDVDDHDLSSYTIKFLVCDFDKFSRHVIIGEVICDLSKLELVPGHETIFNDHLLSPQDENLGEIRVALMYLPTAEKLSVTLLNVRGIINPEGPSRSTETYIKLTLMYDGRPLKKTKTSAKGNDPSPAFNETFVFDVPAYQLDRVYLSLTVIGVNKDREDGRHLIGRLYIGVNFDENARAQWLEMVQNARKQVACWHRLQS
uniref:C2 domain-containing protein n=1 Tax=Arion vulgaris TaxID=1028688 RepID=A0A0B7AJ60_9EUPU